MVVSVLVIVAAIDIPTAVPIGTVTGMLVAIFALFIRDSKRNDERADVTYAKLVAAAEADRDRARAAAEAAQAAVRAQLEQALDECERRWAKEKAFYMERVRHLEQLLYGGGGNDDHTGGQPVA